MRIHCLTHVPFEGPAGIADWAQARRHALTVTPLYAGYPPPDAASYDWLVVMGGPMGVGDEAAYPWLVVEKRAIRDAIDAGKTVLGVCLGAQLIAEVLGARVYRNAHPEIGWMSIELTPEALESPLFGFLPPSLQVFHWHGDTFDLPPGAVHLARSGACAHQAFSCAGRVLGLQFHLESTPASVRDLVTHCADEIRPAPYVQGAERMLAAAPEEYRAINGALFGILDRLAGV
jgi:GMP synthase-like glutamine amidotransferase